MFGQERCGSTRFARPRRFFSLLKELRLSLKENVVWLTHTGFEGAAILKLVGHGLKLHASQGWDLFETLFLSGKPDPDPAIASRKQYEQERYRLEFTVRTFDYAC